MPRQGPTIVNPMPNSGGLRVEGQVPICPLVESSLGFSQQINPRWVDLHAEGGFAREWLTGPKSCPRESLKVADATSNPARVWLRSGVPRGK